MNYWFIRSPYQHRTWDDVLMHNLFRLQGIRNAEASKNIGQMRAKDQVLFYNNIDNRAIDGILEITKTPYPDPTANESKWMAIDAIPVKTFVSPITLEKLKEQQILAESPVLTRPRLSVAPLSHEQFQCILQLEGAM